MKQLEKLMNNQEERIYTIGDLENLSASRLYGFDPSRPSWGGFSISPISQPSFPNLSHQFSYLDSYGKKEEKKEWSQLDTAKIIKEQYDKENKKSEPLKKSKHLSITDFPYSGFQFHFHENDGIISGGKITPYSRKKDDETQLNNYQISMGNLYANLLGIKKIK